MIWDCTGGRFTWNYEKDETFVVLSGEAFITNEKDEERRISPGDIVFFPAGTSSRWHVPSYIKKVAFLRHTMPRPRIWRTCLELIRPESQILGAPNLDRVPIGEEAQDAPGPHIGRY